MFRFLLEARENLAVCTTIDKRESIVKLIFPPENMDLAKAFIADVQRSAPCLPIEVEDNF